MKRKIKGILFLLLGVALLLMAGGWYIYNLAEDNNAGKQATDILEQMEILQNNTAINTKPQTEKPESSNALEDVSQTEDVSEGDAPMVYESPLIYINGEAFCGKVEIEKLGIKLPIYNEWDYTKLKTAPCRYMGNAYTNDMIIAAHNYKSHFGNLKDLEIGDEIKFTDPLGNEYVYAVCEIITLDGTAVSDMNSGDWDFTLFTCTKGGKQRVTVRCERKY